MTFIEIVAVAVFIIIALIGLILVPLGMPGTFVVLAGAIIYNLITWSWTLSLLVLAILLGIALLGELFEYLISVKIAKKSGASNWAVAGAIIGGIIGAVVGVPVFLVGSLIGLFIGVFVGAFVMELLVKGNPNKAFNAAAGAFKGRAGALIIKETLAIAMAIIVLVTVF